MKMRSASASLILFLGACSGGSPAASTGTLSAGDTARGFGVDRYAIVDASHVRLLDVKGVELGTLEVSAPAADARNIDVKLASGAGYLNELSRPVDGRFTVGIQVNNLSDAVELDAALHAFFAAQQIDFSLTPEHKIAPGLQTEDLATCIHANTSSGCYDLTSHPEYYCVKDYETWDVMYYMSTSFPYYDIYTCSDDCSANYPGAGYGAYLSGNDCYCTSGNHYTSITNWVSCPRQFCGDGAQRDLVYRNKTCTDPGSCYQGSQYYSCTPY